MTMEFQKQVLFCLANDDVESLEKLLIRHPEVFGVRASMDDCARLKLLSAIRSPRIADIVFPSVADIGSLSQSWASGFWLRSVDPAVARHLVSRGATLTIHAAAAIGLEEELIGFLDREPQSVSARGGDGARPLHFSRDVATAEYARAKLVSRGTN